ncbi:protein kinase domain-containing protein [Dactylosporangium sp. CA-139066]|uniref:serine/threonine-protein kinase n=1 Tax=Dactylosporangium sp. CA-139066 TaxID=3239930 RepID=UPI003D8AC462
MASEGDLINDRYRLDGPIAAGGMGAVWRATDTLLGRPVAVKLLHDGRSGEREFQARFHHEARAMAALHHPGIAAVYDYGATGDAGAYIVMAYIDGRPLDRRIAEEGRLDPATAMSVVAQAARALEAAHEAGIVHRDVKPGNLIVQPDGTVVLVDFGVARSSASAAVTATNDVVGTALYIAPEQVSKQATGPATDIYALGAVAYHCVAGHPPFMGDNAVAIAVHHLNDEPPPLPADVPAPVRHLITTAMDKAPSARYPSAAALAAAADAAAAAPSTSDTLVSVPLVIPDPPGETPPPRRRVPWWALALAGVAVLAVALTLALSGMFSSGPAAGPTPTASAPGGDGGVGTAPAGGGGGGDGGGGGSKASGAPGQPSTPAATGPQQTPATGGGTTGGGGATPTAGGAETTGPAPETTAPAPEKTTAPQATTQPQATTAPQATTQPKATTAG